MLRELFIFKAYFKFLKLLKLNLISKCYNKNILILKNFKNLLLKNIIKICNRG